MICLGFWFLRRWHGLCYTTRRRFRVLRRSSMPNDKNQQHRNSRLDRSRFLAFDADHTEERRFYTASPRELKGGPGDKSYGGRESSIEIECKKSDYCRP
jgi:hypothetical protein